MDSVSAPKTSQTSKPGEKIFAYDLLPAFEYYADKIKILSLDCFDTLLWRKTAAPTDLFYNLQNRPAFKNLGYTAIMRFNSEKQARKFKNFQAQQFEVQLRDIYKTCFPYLNDETIHALEDDEIAEEISTCYAFPPVVELIRQAHTRGIKIIVVSDTYLNQKQLTQLLSHHLPPDILNAIDTLFCSSEFGISKVNGLFNRVLEKYNILPCEILHIGDNPVSDLAAAKSKNLHAIQLSHLDNTLSEMMRMNVAASSLLDPDVRHSRGLLNLYRGVFATTQFSPEKPEHYIGYGSLGPIMFSFGRFIGNEINKLTNAGKKPKVLFIMRDGYLPSLTCETLFGKAIGKRVFISRFSATAASFRTQDDIDKFLMDIIATKKFKEICRQLLLPNEVTETLIQSCAISSDPAAKFVELVHQEKLLNQILKLSKKYRERLKRHLQHEISLEAGDTAVFVDLGYSGTAQRLLAPVLSDEMNIDVVGRYLISLGVSGWNTSRRGLLDPARCDERMMRTLVAYISLLELLCTSNGPSVEDYDENGNPIFSELNINAEQDNKLKSIQSECLRFVSDADNFFKAINKEITENDLRESAIAELGRLLFLASENEMQYLKAFKFDINLGTKDVFDAFDQEAGLKSLRKRGLFFSLLEKNDKMWRPASSLELRAAGIEFAVTMMASNRFRLEFGMNDLSLRRELLEIVLARGQEISRAQVEAKFTYDGYYSAVFPVMNGNLQIGILFGQKYEWLQIESAELIQMDHYLTETESLFTEDCWNLVAFNQMAGKNGKLYECSSDSCFMMVAVPQKDLDKKYLLRVVFRPLVEKE